MSLHHQCYFTEVYNYLQMVNVKILTANQCAKNSNEISINNEGATQPGKQSGTDSYAFFSTYSLFVFCSKGLQVIQDTAFYLPAASTSLPPCGNTDEEICAAPRIAAHHFLLLFSGNTGSWPCPPQAVGDTHQKVTVPETGPRSPEPNQHCNLASSCIGLRWSCTSQFFSFLFYLSVQQGTWEVPHCPGNMFEDIYDAITGLQGTRPYALIICHLK